MYSNKNGFKGIKNLWKIAVIVMVLLIGIPLAAFFMIKQHGVQTMLVHRILSDISEQTGSEINVGKVRFSFFHDLSLEDVFIADQKKDTLFYAHLLQANFDSLNIFDKKIHVSTLKLNKTTCRVKQFTEDEFNFSFLIDSLFPKDTLPKEKWDFHLKSLNIENGDLAFYGKEDYRIKDTKLRVDLLNVAKDSLNLWVKDMEFIDTAGVVLNDFGTKFILTPNRLNLSDLKLQTDHSEADIVTAEISGDSVLHHIIDPKTAVTFDVNELRIASSDMRRFIAKYPDLSEKIFFSGKVNGSIGDIRGNDLLLSAGGAFDLLFSISITGLPDYHNSFIFADFNRMFISPKDVIPELEKHMKRQMPFKNELKKFGRLLYTGSLTGFPGDFVAFGELNSELGAIHADVALKDNVALEKIEISGNVNTKSFNIGKVLDKQDELGFASMNVELEIDDPYDDYMSMFMNGEVSSLEFHGYTYTNIFLRGVFGNKQFNGGVNINDPNLSLLFTGRIDFSDVTPIFDFEADIRKIAPYQLNLSQKFETGILNTQLKTKLKGDALENLEGYIGFYDLKYSNKNGEIATPNATVFFNKEFNSSSIQINSDWLNGQIVGVYQFNELKNSFAELINPFLPTLAKTMRTKKSVSENQFDFSFRISNIDNIARIFDLPFSISSSGSFKGTIDDDEDILNLSLSLDKTRFRKIRIDTLNFDIKRTNRDMETVLSMNKLDMNHKFLENIKYTMTSKGDSIENSVIWKNNSSTVYEGSLNTGYTLKRIDDDLLQSTFNIRPSHMTISDSLWIISPAKVVIDTTGVDFTSVYINNNDRFLAANGKLSKLKSDTFNLDVEGFELEYLSRFINVENLLLQGNITGQSVINAGFGNPVINSDFRITDFVLNNIYAGDMDVKSDWDEDNRKMNIYGENVLSQDQKLDIKGAYFPADDSLNLTGELKNLPVKYIQPYLETIMQNMQGLGSGNITLEGNVKHLKLIGDVYLDNGSFDVGYLNTRYFLSDSVHLVEDAIEFNNIKIYDINGHSGTFNGELKHKTFKDMEFDMFLDFNDMLALNTTVKDNDLYYGTVYGTGVMAIYGKGSKVHMDINAKTESNSEIFLPLTSTEVASESGFVRFVSQEASPKEVEEEEEQLELSGFSFNMEVEATPDAKVELIFDSRIGDVIKGQGSGTLDFNYDAKSDFKMYGDYTVTSGEYLFTAQNVINKRFDIEPGGEIKWSGDPYNATLNLDAYYRTKASLYDLLPTGSVDDVNKTLRIPVNCHMMLTDNLMNPNIKFDVVLPTADQVTQQSVENVLSSENEVQRQVIYLLMFNRFYTPENAQSSHPTYATSNQAAVVTGSEFLSNQLSNWLSQISDDFDLGVNYRPADAASLTKQEVEMMFSTKMFNDKLSINGNFGYRETQTAASNFVGDFDVDYRLNPKGNFKLKAYSHTNDNIIYENSPTTQGFGFVYKEEFNSFGELVQHYKDLLKKNEEDGKDVNEDTSRK